MSLLDRYDPKVSEPELATIVARVLGVGAGTPTKVYGRGITVGRTGVGVYTLTFAASPGTWVGCPAPGFSATTPADVNGWSAVVTATSSTVITVTVYNETFAAADLPAASWLYLELNFESSGA